MIITCFECFIFQIWTKENNLFIDKVSSHSLIKLINLKDISDCNNCIFLIKLNAKSIFHGEIDSIGVIQFTNIFIIREITYFQELFFEEYSHFERPIHFLLVA